MDFLNKFPASSFRWGKVVPRQEMRFPLIFMLLLMAFSAALFLLPFDLSYAFRQATCRLSVLLANLIGLDAFHENGTVISIAGKRLDIILDCTALNYFVIYTAALLAWPAGLRKKVWGLFVGLSLIMILNISRIVCLGWIGGSYPDWFGLFHKYVYEGGFLVMVLLLWIAWTRVEESSFVSISVKGCTDLLAIVFATILVAFSAPIYNDILVWVSTFICNILDIPIGRLTGYLQARGDIVILYARGNTTVQLFLGIFSYLPFLLLMSFSYRKQMRELKTILSVLTGGLILFVIHLIITIGTYNELIKGSSFNYIDLLTSLSLISPVLIWMLIRAVDSLRNVNNEHMKAGSATGLLNNENCGGHL